MEKILITIFLTLYLGVLTAQPGLQMIAGFKRGIIKEKTHANFASAKFSGLAGFHFGALGEFRLSESTTLNTGLVYSLRGATLETTSYIPGVIYSERIKLNYLEIPVLYTIKPGNIVVFLGPQYSKLLNAKSGPENVTNEFRKSSVDLTYGFGFISDRGLGIQISFITGISNIIISNERSWRSNAFCFTAVYAIKKSRWKK